jgi:hypothetical protein|nr:MAG TPA: hypothetical protein [Caudoviricetes sp.]
MRLIEAFEIVTNSIEDDIKFCKEINNDFDDEFLEKVIDFLQCRVDVLDRADKRESYYNHLRGFDLEV